jgi:hypothetical protein
MVTLQGVALVNRFIAAAIAYLLITMISGYVQAWIAKKLGDSTAEEAGFLSFNPAIYIDWAGLLLFLLTGFGWGKIVPINPFYFSGRFKRFELFFAYASRPLVNGMLGLMTLAILDMCFGGYALTLPVPAFFAHHAASTKALKSVLILMTSFSIFFSLYSAVLVLFRIFLLQLLGPMNIAWYEAELISTLLAIFLLILFANQVEYVLSFIVIHTELFIWYWWYTAARIFGFLSWYQ